MNSYPITIEQYNYMIAVPGFRAKMLRRRFPNDHTRDECSFVGSDEDYRDFLNRCAYLD